MCIITELEHRLLGQFSTDRAIVKKAIPSLLSPRNPELVRRGQRNMQTRKATRLAPRRRVRVAQRRGHVLSARPVQERAHDAHV